MISSKDYSDAAPTFGAYGSPVSKREKFKWENPGPRGTFLEIPKADLQIDSAYQREAVSRAKVIRIAREFRWEEFGTLRVACRKNGDMFVWDGGHRLRAALMRDDVDLLPCMVFDVAHIKDEARSFYNSNTMISNVSAFHRLRSLNLAEDDLASRTMAILNKYDYRPTQDGSSKKAVSAIACIMRLVGQDPELADIVFGLCVEIGNYEEQPPAQLMEAVHYLLINATIVGANIATGRWRETLIQTGIHGLVGAISREKHIAGVGGARIGAKAILDLLNKGRRNKLVMP